MLPTPKWNKVFIVGLPRTGTTSVCIRLLESNLHVAHTAFTKECFAKAQVLADVPIFSDYEVLYEIYPNSKFVLLERNLDGWLPSIERLLKRMNKNLVRSEGGFYPLLKESYQSIFEISDKHQDTQFDEVISTNRLINCYNRHKQRVKNFFSNKHDALLSIDVSTLNSCKQLLEFLEIHGHYADFPITNIKNKITYWKTIQHPLKVHSIAHLKGNSNFIKRTSELR